jgi:HlyD family secretion protein
MKKKIFITIGVLLILGAGGFYFFKSGSSESKFRTEKVTKGTIRATVTANGTVNAVTTVLVGTQVSGTIKNLYVDFNSPVKKGQLLALIDPATFEAQTEQARANLVAARANLEKSEAAELDTKRTMERNRVLFSRNLVARSELDTAETNYTSAVAQVSVAKAQIEQQMAALKTAEINLRYTRILSPVDGTVISRSVDVGQTVAASFQTPTLFNIAQDLTRMQVNTSVAEADIGRIKMAQPVEFTVDAYPDIVFQGKVSEVRNAPVTVQNVVTYDVIVKVDNPDFKLKPGMTANVSIITAEKNEILRISNLALRFKMPSLKSADAKQVSSAKPAQAEPKGASVWVLNEQSPKRIRIATGISDGTLTEVVSGDLKAAQEVIVESLEKSKKNGASNAPNPRMFR